MTYDAIIIGAGPGGATAALMLARAGWSVAIIEKKEFPRRKVCGEFISATSLPLLGDLGLLERFLDLAGPEVRRVGLFAGDTILASPMPQPAGAAARWGRALGREHLDALILQAAVRAGAELWQPWSARQLRREGETFVCEIAGTSAEKTLAGRVVIAAHGSWEKGSLPTQTARAHRPSDLLAFKAHFRGAGLPPDLMPLLVFPSGYGGMVHSDGGRVSLSCCIRRDVLERCRRAKFAPHAADAVLRHIESSTRGVAQALTGARLDGAWLSAGPIRPGIRRRFASGIFLVGNAAGEAHPIVAEGISMAMQGAALACARLIACTDRTLSSNAIAEAGRDYSAAWEASFATRIRAAAVFAQLAMRPAVASSLTPILKRFPGILTFGAQLSGKAAPTAGRNRATLANTQPRR